MVSLSRNSWGQLLSYNLFLSEGALADHSTELCAPFWEQLIQQPGSVELWQVKKCFGNLWEC